MDQSVHSTLSRIVRVGGDQVTLRGNDVIIDARRRFVEWKIREFTPVPIYFQDRKYLLRQSRPGNHPFAVRYVLTAWPEKLISNTIRFHTYDEQAVAERDKGCRREVVERWMFSVLLPLFPFLGFLWSSWQQRLSYVGFVPRYLTRVSIAAVPLVFIPLIVLSGSLGWIPSVLLGPVIVVVFAGLVDTVMRSHHCLRDETWCGGFFEWALPRMRESPAQEEAKTPGFLTSLEILVWNFIETASRSNRKNRKPSLTATWPASLPPIVERELREALRKQRPVRRRLRFAAACTGMVLILSVIAGRSAGRELHHLLCLAGVYVALSVPQRIAGLFSVERREQTLGLLFISGLSATEVFLSKVLSAMAIVFSDLLAFTPVLALPFLMGGISFELFVATFFCLPNTLLFMLAISLLASVLCDDEGIAVLVTTVIGISTAGIPLAIYFAQQVLSTHPWDWLLLFNPAYGPWLLLHPFSTAQAIPFWTNWFITFGESAVCLSVAGFVLRRYWRQREEHGWIFCWRERWSKVVHGASRWRKKVAIEWLEQNPCVWLAARDRGPLTVASILFGGAVLAWLICWAIWRSQWLSVINLFVTAALFNLGLRWIIHYTAAAGLAAARRDNAYELLLTTTLAPRQIVQGHLLALGVRFRKLSRVILGVEIAMMVGGLLLREWRPASLAVYFLLWAGLLAWEWQQSWNFGRTLLSMWAGLNSARPLKAVWRLTGFNAWIWVWILLNLRAGFGISKFPTGSIPELVFVFTVIFIVFVILFNSGRERAVLERRLASEFREIMREPIPDPRDHRFRQWNIRERFPWGWEIAKDQLHERLYRRSE